MASSSVILGLPSAAQVAANTAAIAALSAQLDARDQKESVRAASLTSLTLSGTQTIDGVACIAGDRVAALGQTLSQNSGIYVVAAGAWSRAADADTSAEVTSGMFFWVAEGTANGDKVFELTTDDPIVLGTTPLTFQQYAGALKASQIVNDSAVTGATSKLALETLQTAITANTAAIALKADKYRSYRAHTGTSDTTVLGDGGNVVTSNNASAVAQAIPANATVAYPVDTTIEFLELGAGQLTLTVTSDTLIIPPGFVAKTRGVGCSIYATKIASTTWKVSGDLATT